MNGNTQKGRGSIQFCSVVFSSRSMDASATDHGASPGLVVQNPCLDLTHGAVQVPYVSLLGPPVHAAGAAQQRCAAALRRILDRSQGKRLRSDQFTRAYPVTR
jgi:hypothetical protein